MYARTIFKGTTCRVGLLTSTGLMPSQKEDTPQIDAQDGTDVTVSLDEYTL